MTTAIVTGGSSGLGLSLAEGLADEGLSVAILGRDGRKLDEAVDRLRAGGGDAHGYPCDVSSQAQVTEAFGRIAVLGTPGFLFNVAGVGRFGPVEEITEEMIDQVMAGNLTGLMIATAAALPLLRGHRGGTIVSVLSTAALVGRASEAVYCAAKWGARGFMEAVRAAVKGTSIRTLTVYPGGMRTPFWPAQAGQAPDLATYMDPRDVARQILQVALDPAGTHVTEMTINRP
jgi:NAD(P)-dependent dehydrogenase (short-subunit alcohol dehydrogenase family)